MVAENSRGLFIGFNLHGQNGLSQDNRSQGRILK